MPLFHALHITTYLLVTTCFAWTRGAHFGLQNREPIKAASPTVSITSVKSSLSNHTRVNEKTNSQPSLSTYGLTNASRAALSDSGPFPNKSATWTSIRWRYLNSSHLVWSSGSTQAKIRYAGTAVSQSYQGPLTTGAFRAQTTTLSPMPTSTASTSRFESTRPSQSLQYTQVDDLNSTTVFSIPITTTLSSLPGNFSTSFVSRVTTDTTTTVNGTVYPVLHTSGPGSIMLAGLGSRPSDPQRPGCNLKGLQVFFQTLLPCGAALKVPGIGVVVIDPKGIPRLVATSSVPSPNNLIEPDIIPDTVGDDGENETDSEQKTKISSDSRKESTSYLLTSSLFVSRTSTSLTRTTAITTRSSAALTSENLTDWLIYPSPSPNADPSSLRNVLQSRFGHDGFSQVSIIDGSMSEDSFFIASMNDSTVTDLESLSELVSRM